MDQIGPALPIIAFLVVFPLFWSAIVWLLALLSGWRALASRYGVHEPATVPAYTGVSGGIGYGLPINFNHILQVSLERDGIRLRCVMPAIGRPFPMLRVPWGAIATLEPRTQLFGTGLQMTVREWSGRIVLRGRAAAALLTAWNERRGARDPKAYVPAPPEAAAPRTLLLIVLVGLLVAAAGAVLFFLAQR